MNYEERYKDALERAKELIAKWKGKNKDFYIEDYSYIFPELAESEDEKIRKFLVDYFTSYKIGDAATKLNGYRIDDILAYLEKQKEPHIPWYDLQKSKEAGYTILKTEEYEELIKQKENPKNAYSIPADCTSLAKCEDRDSKYGVFPEDVIVVARACEKLEAHGYPELAHALKNVNLYTKEQKSVEIHIDNPNVQKFYPDMKVTTSDSSADGKELLYVSNKSYNIGFRDGVASVKPVEWSEKDKLMIECCQRAIAYYKENAQRNKKGIPLPAQFDINGYLASPDEVKTWLESLRPSWKPSVEQMRALDNAIPMCMGVVGRDAVAPLESLYEQLKKL